MRWTDTSTAGGDPRPLARQEELRRFRAMPATAADIDAMNRRLNSTNDLIEASDHHPIRSDGITVTASNHDRADRCFGQNFIYRPCFTKALASGSGRFFALGTTSGLRGCYFALPVCAALGRVAGTLVLEIGACGRWRGGAGLLRLLHDGKASVRPSRGLR